MTDRKYFPHIDGLRAFAVIAVILFHYQIPYFSGGYVGVDIFFVISGFLISGIIQNQYRNGTFKFFNFYKKRFYRIYPAVLFICAITFLCAVSLFSPTHFAHLGKNLLGALSFTSNFIYWKSIGYFQILDGYDPFIPTWSLSIEMQYYLVFPIFYVLLIKFFKGYAGWLMLLSALASLILTEILSRFTSNFVYYNLPFRFFEFAIGTLCFHILQSQKMHDINTTFFSIIGTLLIAVGVILFDNQTPFPGVFALLPCFGAALIILSRAKNTPSLKIYDNPFMVYIGKISYSFYLIHWPVYVLFGYWYFTDMSLATKGMLFLVSAVLAALTYHFVENSYRHSSIPFRKRMVLLISTLCLCACAISAIYHKGWSWRLSDMHKELLDHINAEDELFRAEFDQKFPMPGEKDFIPENHAGLECSYNNTKDSQVLMPCLQYNLNHDGRGGYLIIGDSNGANTYRALEKAYPAHNFAMVQQAGCAATSYLDDARSGSWCFKDLKDIVQSLQKDGLIRGLILTSRWVLQPYGQLIRNNDQYDVPVMVVGPTPMLKHDTFETVFMLGIDDIKTVKPMSIDSIAFQKDVRVAENTLKSAYLSSEEIFYISKINILCPHAHCPLFIGDDDPKPLFLDDQHLSSAGISYFASGLRSDQDVQEFFKITNDQID